MTGAPATAHSDGADDTAGLMPGQWAELEPLVRRVAAIDAAAPVRIRRHADRVTALAVLPSGAVVGRTLPVAPAPPGSGSTGSTEPTDRTARAGERAGWLGDRTRPAPAAADAAWTRAVPPAGGWQRIDTVPATVVRDLVRQGADLHRLAADRGSGARAARELLETAVLTVSGTGGSATLSNRELAAIVSMAFLPENGVIVVSRNGRWTRAAAQFGSAFSEDARGGLSLL